MIVLNETDIITLIEEDEWMMEILKTAHSLNLPDWWICAGFVRTKIWDVLHGFSVRTPIPDIDVIYFNTTKVNVLEEKQLEEKLKFRLPNIPWSVKNEARMHLRNHVEPYSSSVDAISKFPETATALGVKLDERDKVILTAPCGISDAVNLKVKPTPYFLKNADLAPIYNERILKKNWQATWNKVSVHQI
ncbi:nucleotidyltransferase family protein [Alkalihalobacillus sp. MEB203]|uniref:Nucleotidyltransferase family protein n=2 Tax=Alkalihalobacterium chitinilyticum TaxID=2980103 RepID=A0ABT5VGI2_9BACI|nr:nucleotidyltransferase family protein [Alkalihalobacterium chitinilyticum]MDE5414566.1 nucleotidyltransferase family protein [Alkalihalobacterium chitinilyticum]